ncbi:DUF58 domain-containing protein [Candidatus Methylobacter oryzae]|uniref:DUF58 domain-containing protein n=1 Tax=Candidatus Methylobacter oryzae TaxID=2497749 RepID=A0ABY3C9V8_9GAMM|nr:DUF58 domain-containing protein [Candidatus Methylobacter oryzae]TRW94230.1 DUF58 domain-containing protein [Candidatus Methylobacter oryzae]
MLQSFLLRQYRRVYRFDNWMRRHFTFTGHLVIAFTIAAAVFGVNTKQSTTYQLFVFLLVLLVLSILNSSFNRLKVTLNRRLPRYGMVGEPLRYTVTLTNLTPRTYGRLALCEQLAEIQPSATQLLKFYQLHQSPWFKQVVNFRRWLRYLAYQRGGVIAETALPDFAQAPLQVQISFTPTRRGTITFTDSYLAKPDLLGLFRRLIVLKARQSCLILPKHYPIKPLTLAGKRKYQAGGVSLANSVGNSSEFMSLRDYQRGDPLNSIHWKSFAKHGKLIVKEYQDEYFVRRALLLDTFAGDAATEQFEAAVSVAASIAVNERQNEALLDLMFVGLQTYCFTAGRGVDQLPHLQEILAAVQPGEQDSFAQLRQAVLARIGLCSSLVCVLMHWDQVRQDFIKQLLSHDLPVAVFLLHDGSLGEQQCANKPEHFYLLDYRRLAEQLAAL